MPLRGVLAHQPERALRVLQRRSGRYAHARVIIHMRLKNRRGLSTVIV